MADVTVANPLYLSWVKEWWEVAKQRKSKGEITYKHAYDSLRACPIKFQHPSELQSLRGFGEKLCKRLTEQLQKHCEENGLQMPKVSRKRKRATRLPGEDEEDGTLPAAGAPPAQRPRTSTTAPKRYVPKYRSGGFAVLYVLAGQDPNAPPGMSKADLIAAAQPYCDASLTLNSDQSRHYNAWNSVNTLLKQELITKRGRPVERYALTEEGKEVAAKVREVVNYRNNTEAGNGSGSRSTDFQSYNPLATGSGTTPGSGSIIQARTNNMGTSRGNATQAYRTTSSSEFLTYTGYDDRDDETSFWTQHLADAFGTQPRTVAAGRPAAAPRQVASRQPVAQSRASGGYGFLTDAGYNDYEREDQLRNGNQFAATNMHANEGSLGARRPAFARNTSQRVPPQELIVLDDDDDEEVVIKDTKPKRQNEEYKDVVVKGENVANDTSLPNITPIRLAPGSFTVELVIDNREIRAKTDRDYMQQELMKRGVRPITRPLAIGDFLWVAKCKQPGWLERMGASEPRFTAEGHRDTAGDQVVLDWIVERKRLDDLISSNKDGRYREQKFRLRKSGVKNVVYVIEHKNLDADYYQRNEAAVETMLAQLQVVNGYFVKKTKTTDDTIKYLASMTQMLQKMYEGKPLYVIRSKDLTVKNYLPLLDHLRKTKPDMSHHIVYPAFASLCSKSEMMTLRDVFLKMLMCTKLLTGEKAIEIQKIWKTPHEFVKAFEDCGQGEEGRRKKINMVADRLDHLYGNKRISKPLSQRIAEIWGDA
ncbi:ERCC4 domain-containing protein [Cladorrhinum sp. PSN259]|nr:ERCC4 domain-containing protein [Cladorrhinum sp. PSN259]